MMAFERQMQIHLASRYGITRKMYCRKILQERRHKYMRLPTNYWVVSFEDTKCYGWLYRFPKLRSQLWFPATKNRVVMTRIYPEQIHGVSRGLKRTAKFRLQSANLVSFTWMAFEIEPSPLWLAL